MATTINTPNGNFTLEDVAAALDQYGSGELRNYEVHLDQALAIVAQARLELRHHRTSKDPRALGVLKELARDLAGTANMMAKEVQL